MRLVVGFILASPLLGCVDVSSEAARLRDAAPASSTGAAPASSGAPGLGDAGRGAATRVPVDAARVFSDVSVSGADRTSPAADASVGLDVSVGVDVSADFTDDASATDGEAPFWSWRASDAAHYENRASERGLGETLRYGRGAAFVDLDGDGDDDLFVTDTDGRFGDAGYGVSRAYANRGDGTFEPLDIGLDEADLHGTWVASFADTDNDGDADLLIGNGGYTLDGTLAFYENRLDSDGVFVDRTDASGVGAASAGAHAWWGASWADYDRDGYLDAAVTRRGSRLLLLHNEGDGTFVEMAEAYSIGLALAKDIKNPVWWDYDEDGDPDLYVAGVLWHGIYRNRVSEGEGFQDVTAQVFDPPIWDAARGGPTVFAAATADFDQDGHEDLYLGRWDQQDLVLFNEGGARFTQLGAEAGLDTETGLWSPEAGVPFENTMGLGVGDLFDDGWPDLVVGTGQPANEARDIVFCNLGARRFERCTDRFREADAGHRMTRGHAPAFSDIDGDGYLDLYFNLGGHPNWDRQQSRDSREVDKLFVRKPSRAAPTASLLLRGTRSNRDAVGARVTLQTPSATRYYAVRSTQGFQAQSGRALLLVLGDAGEASLTVVWPSGVQQQVAVTRGERLTVVEP